ncbi:hypothetical protein BJ508DRAFT_114559 [Ascobolus immersus RN42]|uniref:Uncharacterized protein n=1 Tax=Ascobolus immersus RN42 TaxID=1160509 RepID=A0A3N4IID0_ASCIM|nr:hypothetical protein BJ508DRAFT_114559 [Ascobolus immersus RN42]
MVTVLAEEREKQKDRRPLCARVSETGLAGSTCDPLMIELFLYRFCLYPFRLAAYCPSISSSLVMSEFEELWCAFLPFSCSTFSSLAMICFPASFLTLARSSPTQELAEVCLWFSDSVMEMKRTPFPMHYLFVCLVSLPF